ncbi:MAG: hypothetical protein EA403_16955 [Spirochaetaceae bacterium]|nr:MAG: hypothetical protein EA403_16955 [Spirochaetaceae bacterium]
MSTVDDVLRILQTYTRRAKTAQVEFSQLLTFTTRYLEKVDNDDLRDLEDNTENLLAARLLELEKSGRVAVHSTGGKIVSIDYREFYPSLVSGHYQKMHDRPLLPFPDESMIGVTIPADAVFPVDVRTDFVSWLARSQDEPPVVVRLMFPDGVKSILAGSQQFPRTLAELSVQKIRAYLRSEKNVSYIRSKLGGAFRNRESMLKEMLQRILTTPDSAIRSVMEPDDFSFHFWTTLSSVLIKDIAPKKDKLQEDHDYAQAAYLLGYYNVHHKAIVQRRRETEMAVQMLDNRLSKEPYAFTISDIYNFTDAKGVLLTKRYTTQDIHDYLAERLRPGSANELAPVVRVKGPDGKDYYIRKEFVLKVLIERLFDISREFADHYVDTWVGAMKEDRRPTEMTDDATFSQDVQTRMTERYPMICALLRFDLLYLCAGEQKLMGEAAAEINRLFDREARAIRPMHQILQLDRKKLADDARLLLPFWQAFPWLNAFVRFLQRVFLGTRTPGQIERSRRKKGPRKAARILSSTAAPVTEDRQDSTVMQLGDARGADGGRTAPSRDSTPTSGGATRKVQAQEFRRRIEELQKGYVGDGGSVDAKLEELIERWNPLLDPVAKSNLVEDVNSLVRDFLRRMKVGFRLIPPDRARIQGFAEKLSQSDVFNQIRRKDALKTYLELYMLKILGKING